LNLATNPTQRLFGRAINLSQYHAYQWAQMFNPVADRHDDKDRYRESSKFLLKLKVLLHRQEDVASGRGEFQQLSILCACPSTLG